MTVGTPKLWLDQCQRRPPILAWGLFKRLTRRLKTIHGPGIILQEPSQARDGMLGRLRQGRAQNRTHHQGHGLQNQLALRPKSSIAHRMHLRRRRQLQQHLVSHYLPSQPPLCQLLLPQHQLLPLLPLLCASQTLSRDPCVRPPTRTHCLFRLISRSGPLLSLPSLRQTRALSGPRPCRHPSLEAPRPLLAL